MTAVKMADIFLYVISYISLYEGFIMYSIVTSAFMRIPMSKNIQDYSKKAFEKGYVYDLVNVITGEKSTKKESELIS